MTERRVGNSLDLSIPQMYYLVKGHVMWGGSPPFVDEGHMRQCWFANRDALLALRDLEPRLRLQSHLFFDSGTRPYGWWQFEAEEPWPLYEFKRLAELNALEPGE